VSNTTPKYWALLNNKDIISAELALENLMVLLQDFNQDKQPPTGIQYLLKKIIEQAKDQGYNK